MKGGKRIPQLPKTERKTYVEGDSGCAVATKYQGFPSHCLECPLSKCSLDMDHSERMILYRSGLQMSGGRDIS